MEDYIHQEFNLKFNKIQNTEQYVNIYQKRKKYPCPGCFIWFSGKNFHRHIDECKHTKIEKELCFNCRRDCVIKICFGNIVIHRHKCSRRAKVPRKTLIESKLRKYRRWKGEKKGPKKFKTKQTMYDNILLHKIVSDFVNEKRNNRIRYIAGLKEGFSPEYLNLFYSENQNLHFRQIFACWIGNFGRFVGDDDFFMSNFSLEKLKNLDMKSISYFSSNLEKTEIDQKIHKNVENFVTNYGVPMFKRVILKKEIFLTYLLACAQRREIDVKLGISDKFGKKITDDGDFWNK